MDHLSTEQCCLTTHVRRTGLQVGQRYGLPVIAPVDDAGVFTEEAGPVAGLDAMTEGSKKVVDLLRSAGALLKVSSHLSADWPKPLFDEFQSL